MLVTSSLVSAESFQVLDFLKSVSGTQTLAGQHNREPNTEPAMWTDKMHELTGKYPALWSGDFLFQQDNIDNRWTMVKEAKKQWDKDAVINIMWHACPPDEGEPCGWEPGRLKALLRDEWGFKGFVLSDLGEIAKQHNLHLEKAQKSLNCTLPTARIRLRHRSCRCVDFNVSSLSPVKKSR